MGNVGGALARRLVEDVDEITRAAGRPIRLEAIAVRTPRRDAPAPIISSATLLERSDLDAIVEVIGGLEPAHTYIHMALQAGRQVITANKQLIAKYGPNLAGEGPLRFEASVASAIPIVEALAESLGADRILTIEAILNGTTNSMLRAMEEGFSYAEALADAQERGMAEADPSSDVDGHDAAAKLAILAMLAFRRRIDVDQIERIGIRNLKADRLVDASRQGFAIKLVAAATHDDGTLRADVRPRRIPRDAPLGRVDGALNGIAVEAEYAGTLVFIGPGAGPDAAASAVLADLIRAARDIPASAGAVLAELADEAAVAIEPFGNAEPYPAVD